MANIVCHLTKYIVELAIELCAIRTEQGAHHDDQIDRTNSGNRAVRLFSLLCCAADQCVPAGELSGGQVVVRAEKSLLAEPAVKAAIADGVSTGAALVS